MARAEGDGAKMVALDQPQFSSQIIGSKHIFSYPRCDPNYSRSLPETSYCNATRHGTNHVSIFCEASSREGSKKSALGIPHADQPECSDSTEVCLND